ncbi:MAG TPA: aldo/keto reductase [Verrucomicrobia bacterium]|nr:MAG: aldo/keto reductase [Lentisphaerae bacterium GWF2_57_35]HBA82594.1 aldo/keto reductase [Verrucomicrobiota bacterium]
METRKLGYTDLELSTVGLGTWSHGGSGWTFSWGPQDDRESIATIRAAVAEGINWIDTAAVYGLGHSEEVLGRALRGMREPPLIATKCGLVWDSVGHITGRLTTESVRTECNASLKRLGIERIDLYQIHWPNPPDQIEEGWSAIVDLIREGKVRCAGVSNFSVDQMKRVQAIHPVASLQPPYSLLARGIEQEVLPFCVQQNIGVICYSPLQKGLLTGKITPSYVASMPSDDHRRNDPMFNEPLFGEWTIKIDKLKRIAARKDCLLSQLAIAWLLRRPAVTSVIVGARTPAHIRDAVSVDLELIPQDLQDIEFIFQQESLHESHRH